VEGIGTCGERATVEPEGICNRAFRALVLSDTVHNGGARCGPWERRDAVNELIDGLCGNALTHLSGMSARCSRDMQVRRNIDAVVDQIRREIAVACLAKADEWNEPPPDDEP
jgi:hypothetical protein